MRRVKRVAVSIKLKQPYSEWANGLDKDGVKIGAEFTPEENIYLVDDIPEGDLDPELLLEPYFDAIFEEERIRNCVPTPKAVASRSCWAT